VQAACHGGIGMAGRTPRASPRLPSAVGRRSAAYGNFLPRGSGTRASAKRQWALLGPWTADCPRISGLAQLLL